MFGDARAGILTDSNGYPTGLDSHVLNDVTAACTQATKNRVKIVFVLFDFGLADYAQEISGVQTGGRTAWISNATQRVALINNVVIPVLQHLATNTCVAAWEIMNEPEWAISDIPEPSVNSGLTPFTIAEFYAYASAVSAAVHTYTNAPVTIGSAALKWYYVWTPSYATSNGLTPLNLDFYETHYYPWMDNEQISDPSLGGTFWESPMQQNYSTLSLDKEMVVGEFEPSESTPPTVLATVLANGYSGAWPWSILSDWPLNTTEWTDIRIFASTHTSILGGLPGPSGSATTSATTGDGQTSGGSSSDASRTIACPSFILFDLLSFVIP